MIDSEAHSQRLNQVRELLQQYGYDGFIIPHGDEFQNEQLPEYNERLQWLTGFSGSAGFAVVLKEKAALFSDGRYTEQMAQQVNPDHFECFTGENFLVWILANCPQLSVLSYDSWLHSVEEISLWEKKLFPHSLTAYKGKLPNPIDECWKNRFKPPFKITNHVYHGQNRSSKQQFLQDI